MEFAVVDIETTGSTPQSAGITEIAIVIHNGVEVTGKYVTLINPRHKIPPFIVNMTGISDEMVATISSLIPVIFTIKGGILCLGFIRVTYLPVTSTPL